MAYEDWRSAIFGMAGVAIAAAAGLAGGMIERFWLSADVERQTDVQLVSIAAGILAAKPTGENEPLRRWAVEVINVHAPVPMPRAALAALEESAWEFPATAYSSGGAQTVRLVFTIDRDGDVEETPPPGDEGVSPMPEPGDGDPSPMPFWPDIESPGPIPMPLQ